MKTIRITVNNHHVRLDKYLAGKIEFLSRTKVKECIVSNHVLVDGSPAKPSMLLEGGEKVLVEIPEPQPATLKAENIPLDIIFEDDYLLAVNKAPDLVTHPGAGNFSGTLANGLVYYLGSLPNSLDHDRPGIVHRLDKDTSGILLVAKNDEVHLHLSNQFAERTVEKTYLAIVWGTFKELEGMIDKPIIRNPKHRQRFTVGDRGRTAITYWKVINEFEYLTLVELSPKTGRTHQLRVHLASINHPIFSDELYGGGKNRLHGYLPDVQKSLILLFDAIGRQALHALSISFNHPNTGERMTLTAPLLPDYKNLIFLLGMEYA